MQIGEITVFNISTANPIKLSCSAPTPQTKCPGYSEMVLTKEIVPRWKTFGSVFCGLSTFLDRDASKWRNAHLCHRLFTWTETFLLKFYNLKDFFEASGAESIQRFKRETCNWFFPLFFFLIIWRLFRFHLGTRWDLDYVGKWRKYWFLFHFFWSFGPKFESFYSSRKKVSKMERKKSCSNHRKELGTERKTKKKKQSPNIKNGGSEMEVCGIS